MTIFASLKKNIDSLVAAIIGFIFIQILTQHSGIGISPDSINYLSVARNFTAGKGWIDYTGNPIINFPIFYPTFLSSIIFITGKDVLVFAPFLNGFLFALVIYLSGSITQQFTQTTRWYKWVVLSIITFSPSMFEVYSMLWSETLFILFTIFFFITIKNYLQTHSAQFLLLISIISALAFITRYAGITLVATGVLLILLEPSINRRKKIIHILVYGAISISLITVNIIRNAMLTQTFAGSRLKGITPFSRNLTYFGTVVCDWFAFLNNHYSFACIIAIAVLIIFITIFIFLHFKKKFFHPFLKILMAFFIIYSLFIILSSTISRYETINNRLLSPAYIPFIACFFYMLIYLQKSISKKMVKVIFTLGIVALFLSFQYYQYSINVKNYEDIKDDGIPGYAEDVWKNSPTVQFIQKDTLLSKHAGETYCNQNHAVYLFTNYGVKSIPERTHVKEVEAFNRYSNYYIIWFFTDENPDLLSIDEIRKHAVLIQTHSFSDGVIFYCNSNR